MIKLQSIARQTGEDVIMEEVFAAEISRSDGLQGDFSALSIGGEISILSKESWVKVCHETDSEMPWLVHGANLLIKGFEFLPTDIGRMLLIGEVELEIAREHTPSPALENQSPRLYEALLLGWRSGVVCRILRSGNIQSGDSVDIVG